MKIVKHCTVILNKFIGIKGGFFN